MSQTLTKPILLDETGQAIKTALQNIDETEAQDWLLTYEDVHSEMDDNVDRIADALEGIKDILNLQGRTPIGLTVVTPPTKNSYVIGDSFDPAGMSVCAIMTNGVDSILCDVTNYCTYSPSTLYPEIPVTITWKVSETSPTFTTTLSVDVTVPSWSVASVKAIKAALQAHYDGIIDLHEYWSVGEERTVHLSEVVAPQKPYSSYSIEDVGDSIAEQDITMVLLNAGGKMLADGITECAFIVGQKEYLFYYQYGQYLSEKFYMFDKLPSEYSNIWQTGDITWDNCHIRSWCNTTYYSAIPSDIREIFKQHINRSSDGNDGAVTDTYYSDYSGYIDSVDYFALPAEKESFGVNTFANNVVESSLSQFEYYKTSANLPTADVWSRSRAANINIIDGDSDYTYGSQGVTKICCMSNDYYRDVWRMPMGVAPFSVI